MDEFWSVDVVEPLLAGVCCAIAIAPLSSSTVVSAKIFLIVGLQMTFLSPDTKVAHVVRN